MEIEDALQEKQKEGADALEQAYDAAVQNVIANMNKRILGNTKIDNVSSD